jgi:hypothetical protein
MSDQQQQHKALSTYVAPQTKTGAYAPDQGDTGQQPDPKPTETVDFWKEKAREQERRAKANAEAARRLAELEESQKTDAQKAADKLAAAEAEVAAVPAKVAEALREHLVTLHSIDEQDAELFLTGTTPELVLKQAARLLERRTGTSKRTNHVPREGNNPQPGTDDMREFTRDLFGKARAQ